MKKSSIICVTSATVLLVVGLTAVLVLPLILVRVIDSKLVLSPDNPDTFNLWRDLPIPILQNFYFFNVTNPHEVQNSGAVPHLQQVGPFVFSLEVKKFDLNFTDSGQSVYFRENVVYHFERNMSVGDLSTKITTLNTPLAIALKLVAPLNPIMKTMAIFFISRLKEDFFIERTVGQLLFDGYPDILTKMGPILNPKIPYQPNFGYMWARNETNDGLFSVNTGKSDTNSVNAIESLDGKPDLFFWSAEKCNSLKGAKNGELFNPIESTSDPLMFFRTDICRVWQMVYNSKLKSEFGGLSVYRYHPSEHTLANSTEYPPNSCYKPNDSQKKLNVEFDISSMITNLQNLFRNDTDLDIDSLLPTLEESLFALNSSESQGFESHGSDDWPEYPSGVFDLSACHYSAPLFISKPHFFEADPYYLTTVSGLEPNASLHQTYLDVEPITGIPVELQLNLQINVHIEPLASSFSRYKHMPRIHFPVLWQGFAIHLTDEIADKLHWQLTGPSLIAMVISSLFIAIGAITLLVVASQPLRKRCAKHRSTDRPDDCDTNVLIDDNNVESNANADQPVVT